MTIKSIQITPASRYDGFYEVEGKREPCQYDTIKIVESGCKGWPGDTFVVLFLHNERIVSGFVNGDDIK